MSWPFSAKHCEEVYAITDAIDVPTKKRVLDAARLDAFLAALRKRKATSTKKPAARKRDAGKRP